MTINYPVSTVVTLFVKVEVISGFDYHYQSYLRKYQFSHKLFADLQSLISRNPGLPLGLPIILHHVVRASACLTAVFRSASGSIL